MIRRTSVAGLVRKEDAFLVAKRKAGGDLGGKWEFPGGKVEPGETPEEALVREFREEFDVGIRVGEPAEHARFVHAGREYDLLSFYVFMESAPLRLLEHDETAWLTLREILSLDFADSDRKILVKLLRRNI